MSEEPKHVVWFGMGWDGMGWCAMQCYAMLCYAMLCYAMLCYAMLCYGIFYPASVCNKELVVVHTYQEFPHNLSLLLFHIKLV